MPKSIPPTRPSSSAPSTPRGPTSQDGPPSASAAHKRHKQDGGRRDGGDAMAQGSPSPKSAAQSVAARPSTPPPRPVPNQAPHAPGRPLAHPGVPQSPTPKPRNARGTGSGLARSMQLPSAAGKAGFSDPPEGGGNGNRKRSR